MTDSQQAEIDRLRGLMDELHDYITTHDSWRCERYGECRCGLDDLFDRCGWARIPCRPSTDQNLSQHLSHDRSSDRQKKQGDPAG